MSKIKNSLLILSAILSLGFFTTIPAFAASSGSQSWCSHVPSNNQKVSCSDCHPQKGSAPSLCNCYPEYFFGSLLTPAEQSACEKCNNANLKYDVKTDAGKSQLSQACLKANPITNDINIFVNFLAAMATIVIIGTLIAGGIQYSMSGKPEDSTKARKRIINGLIAMAGLFFIWAFLQWLIPGGV